MDRIRKSFRNSFRKKKPDIITESQKPHQWQSDEQSVRSGTCVFHVKYLGCVEVYESRGMQICEDALRRLRVRLLILKFKNNILINRNSDRIQEDVASKDNYMLLVMVYVLSMMIPRYIFHFYQKKNFP